MVRKICLTVVAALTGCAPRAVPVQHAGNQPAEEAAVLAVMDAYMHEIRERPRCDGCAPDAGRYDLSTRRP
jgi:hypothetical protein